MAVQAPVVSGSEAPVQPTHVLHKLLADAFDHPHTRIYRVTLRVILALILLSVVLVILETVPDVYDPQ